jgi:hypothetical protein
MEYASCCANDEHVFGCMVCGAEVLYTSEQAFRAECYYCGKVDMTHAFCLEGHYVCNECHSKDVLELLEIICTDSDLTDPVELALCIFELRILHMHGPEYHSIVPAVLVAAYGNVTNSKNSAAVKEAIARGKAVPGGYCGTHGACGAAIGVGIACSIIHQVTPYSREERGDANRMTARALSAISQFGGPRCCKRDSMLAIETVIEHLGCFTGTGKSRYICSQFPDNSMCIQNKCPYYPYKG